MRSPDMKRIALPVCVVVLVMTLVPRSLAGRRSRAWFEGDPATQDAYGRSLAHRIEAQRDRLVYHTGNARFDGQASVAVYQMTLLALGQIVLAHPETREAYLPAMRRAADHLADPRTLGYATRVYGHHGIVRMGPGQGHAYLGYINLGLGMMRAVDPETPHAALHDRLTTALVRRLAASPNGLIETYPGETWPPDVAAVAGSIGLHARVTATDRSELLDAWAERFAACAIHESGYLVQRVRGRTCDPADAPRGSGTAIASYFTSFAHPALSRRLHDALVERGSRSVLGFAGVREYPRGFRGRGDVNSGPILAGMSVGATGFALGAARVHRNRDLFVGLYRTVHVVGGPVASDGGESFAVGGLLGNALLLAMLTAGPAA